MFNATNTAVAFEEADGSALPRGGDISKRVGKTMRRVIRTGLGLVLAAIALGVPPGLAQNAEPSFDFAGVNVFEHVIPNIEGKSMVAILVTYPPGGKSPAHHHAQSAFI